METLTPLFLYLLVCLPLALLLRHPAARWLRQSLDRRGPSGLDDWAVHRMARMGEEEPSEGALGREVFAATIGLRAVVTALVGLLLAILSPWPVLSDGLPLTGSDGRIGYALLCVIAGCYLYWLHSYRLELRGHWLLYRDMGFRQRNLDLRQLEHVEDSGAYTLRLYFHDGSQAEVLQRVRGAVRLRRRLARAVETNRKL